MTSVKIKFRLLEPDAKAPTQAHPTDSGHDLYAYHDQEIQPHSTANIYTGVAACAPAGWGYTIRGRSSLNKKGVQTSLGTIDSFYSGPLYVLLYNVTDRAYTIKKGDRVAQIVFEQVHQVEFEEVSDFELPPEARGSKGFGSSGV